MFSSLCFRRASVPLRAYCSGAAVLPSTSAFSVRASSHASHAIRPAVLHRHLHSSSASGLRAAGTGGAPGMPQVQEVLVSEHNVDLFYVTYGQGPHNVLFIPGALGCSDTDFPLQLTADGPFSKGDAAERYKLFCVDPRGYGQSRPPERDYPLNFYDRDAEDLAIAMQKLSAETYSIVGWSDGAIIGLLLAAQYPARVRRVLALAPNTFYSKEDISNLRAASDVSKWSKRMLEPLARVYGDAASVQRLWSAFVAACERIHREREQPWPALYGIAKASIERAGGDHKKAAENVTWEISAEDSRQCVAEGGLASGGWPGEIVRARLPIVQCPVLVVQPGRDRLVAPFHANVIARECSTAKILRIPEGGHNLHQVPATAAQFNEAMLNFLNEEQL